MWQRFYTNGAPFASYLSISKLQQLYRRSLGMDTKFLPALYWACDSLSVHGLKLIYVLEKGTPDVCMLLYVSCGLSWWRHQMETFSALLAICVCRKFTGHRWIPCTKPVTRSFGVFFDLLLNKLLSKHWWGWWFKTPSRPIWHHSDDFALTLPYHVIAIFNMSSLLYVARPHVQQPLADELSSWWRHQMETFSTLLAFYEGNPPVTGGFPSQRPVTRGFDVFFDLRLNKRLSKQSRRWWFETPSRSLWRHRNAG